MDQIKDSQSKTHNPYVKKASVIEVGMSSKKTTVNTSINWYILIKTKHNFVLIKRKPL